MVTHFLCSRICRQGRDIQQYHSTQLNLGDRYKNRGWVAQTAVLTNHCWYMDSRQSPKSATSITVVQLPSAMTMTSAGSSHEMLQPLRPRSRGTCRAYLWQDLSLFAMPVLARPRSLRWSTFAWTWRLACLLRSHAAIPNCTQIR